MRIRSYGSSAHCVLFLNPTRINSGRIANLHFVVVCRKHAQNPVLQRQMLQNISTKKSLNLKYFTDDLYIK